MASETLKHHGGLLAHSAIEAYKAGLAENKKGTTEDDEVPILGTINISLEGKVTADTTGEWTEFSSTQGNLYGGKFAFKNDYGCQCTLMMVTIWDEGSSGFGYKIYPDLFIQNGTMKVEYEKGANDGFDAILQFHGIYAKLASTKIGSELLLAQKKADSAVKAAEINGAKLRVDAFEIKLQNPQKFNVGNDVILAEFLTDQIHRQDMLPLFMCRRFMERAFENITEDLNGVGNQIQENLQSVSGMPEDVASLYKAKWDEAGKSPMGECASIPSGNQAFDRAFKRMQTKSSK